MTVIKHRPLRLATPYLSGGANRTVEDLRLHLSLKPVDRLFYELVYYHYNFATSSAASGTEARLDLQLFLSRIVS
jgi:hypothetical protein